MIDVSPVPPPQPMSVGISFPGLVASVFVMFLSITMPLMCPCSSAAFPNLLLLFIFIVSVLSWKLIQCGVILELASYADDKPLTLIKYTVSS